MKISLTKRQVIRALQTEPLMAGSYIHDDEYDDNGVALAPYKNNTGCAVCAVGSLLDCSVGKKFKKSNLLSELGQIGSGITTSAVLHDSESWMNDENGTKSFHELSIRELTALARKEAKAGRYLSALSGLFEAISDIDGYTTNRGLANYRLVNILVNFVKAEFPGKLVINTRKQY